MLLVHGLNLRNIFELLLCYIEKRNHNSSDINNNDNNWSYMT